MTSQLRGPLVAVLLTALAALPSGCTQAAHDDEATDTAEFAVGPAEFGTALKAIAANTAELVEVGNAIRTNMEALERARTAWYAAERAGGFRCATALELREKFQTLARTHWALSERGAALTAAHNANLARANQLIGRATVVATKTAMKAELAVAVRMSLKAISRVAGVVGWVVLGYEVVGYAGEVADLGLIGSTASAAEHRPVDCLFEFARLMDYQIEFIQRYGAAGQCLACNEEQLETYETLIKNISDSTAIVASCKEAGSAPFDDEWVYAEDDQMDETTSAICNADDVESYEEYGSGTGNEHDDDAGGDPSDDAGD